MVLWVFVRQAHVQMVELVEKMLLVQHVLLIVNVHQVIMVLNARLTILNVPLLVLFLILICMIKENILNVKQYLEHYASNENHVPKDFVSIQLQNFACIKTLIIYYFTYV